MLSGFFDCARAEPNKPPEAPRMSKSRRFMSSLPRVTSGYSRHAGANFELHRQTLLSEFETIRFRKGHGIQTGRNTPLRAPARSAFPMRSEVQPLHVPQMF